MAGVFRFGSQDEDDDITAPAPAAAAAAAASSSAAPSRATSRIAATEAHADDNRTVISTARTTIGGTKPNLQLLPFKVLCKIYFERMMNVGRGEKEKLVKDLWKRVFTPGVSMYPVMRLLLPQLDSERATYGLRESSLGDAYIDALALGKKVENAVRLKNYKRPIGVGGASRFSESSGVSGDFTLVLADVLRKYSHVKEPARNLMEENTSKLTLGDINQMLDTLAQSNTETGGSAVKQVFAKALAELSPLENMWFCRIILKDLKIGIKHESMLKLFAADALQIYNSCSSLRRVCELTCDPTRKPAEFTPIEYFRAFKPMLASNPPWDTIMSRMRGLPMFVEPKFDGERIIVHKKGDEIKLFTRNSVDYTNRYAYGAHFNPIATKALDGYDCIIDGEMMAYDKTTGRYMQFGQNRVVAIERAFHLDDSRQLCYIAFDILMLNNELLLKKPLKDRREMLHKVVRPIKQQFEVISHRSDVTNTDQLLEALRNSVDQGMEGVICKSAMSTYNLAERSDNWIKVKEDHIEGLRDTMDLILIGGYYGEGTRRSGAISHFLLGVYEHPISDAEAERLKDRKFPPPRCYSFVKVGSGYSLKALEALRAKLEPKFQQYDTRKPPKLFMDWKPERDDIPDMWLDPRDSVIIEVKAYEITACRPNKFSAGFTCRFPRVNKIREDKDWFEGMNFQDLIKLRDAGSAKANAAFASRLEGVKRRTSESTDAFGNVIPPRENHDEPEPMKKEEAQSEAMDWKDEMNLRLGMGSSAALSRAASSSTANQGLKPIPGAAPGGMGGASLSPEEDAAAHLQEEAPFLAAGEAAAALPAAESVAPPVDFMSEYRDALGRGPYDVIEGVAAAGAAGALGAGLMMDDKPGGRRRGNKRKKEVSEKKASAPRGSVISLFRPTDVSNIVTYDSDIFHNKSFCVMSYDEECDKATLERLIALNGGTFTQNPMAYTFCIIARHGDTIRVAAQRKAGTKDIIHYSWLLDCAREKCLLPWTKKYIIAGTASTMTSLAREIDVFGDSFAVDADAATFRESVKEYLEAYSHPYEGLAEIPPEKRQKIMPLSAMNNNHNNNKPPTAQESMQAIVNCVLNTSRAPSESYSSLFHSFDAAQQRELSSSSSRPLLGCEVYLYGASGLHEETTAAGAVGFDQQAMDVQLALLTLRLLGARQVKDLRESCTHILMPTSAKPDATGAFTKEALMSILPAFQLKLHHASMDENLDGAVAASSSADSAGSALWTGIGVPPKGICQLIDLKWVEQLRSKFMPQSFDE